MSAGSGLMGSQGTRGLVLSANQGTTGGAFVISSNCFGICWRKLCLRKHAGPIKEGGPEQDKFGFPFIFWSKVFRRQKIINGMFVHLTKLIPDICHFFTLAKFLENKIYTKKRQISALNLYKFTPAKKNLHGYTRGARDKYQVCYADPARTSSRVIAGIYHLSKLKNLQ